MALTAIARGFVATAAAIVLLGIGTAGAAFAEKSPHPGRVAALRGIDRGVIRCDVGGIALPMAAELQNRAMSEYGITVNYIGCIGVPHRIPGFTENYRKAVREHLVGKHGFDPVAKLELELMQSATE